MMKLLLYNNKHNPFLSFTATICRYAIKNEANLITRYRETSLVPECDAAIDDIINECVVSDTQDRIVSLDLRDVEATESIKNKMLDEFNYILSLMKFNQNSHEIFRKWYVDGEFTFIKSLTLKTFKGMTFKTSTLLKLRKFVT